MDDGPELMLSNSLQSAWDIELLPGKRKLFNSNMGLMEEGDCTMYDLDDLDRKLVKIQNQNTQ